MKTIEEIREAWGHIREDRGVWGYDDPCYTIDDALEELSDWRISAKKFATSAIEEVFACVAKDGVFISDPGEDTMERARAELTALRMEALRQEVDALPNVLVHLDASKIKANDGDEVTDAMLLRAQLRSAALDELAALRETNAENEKRLLAFIAENRELRWKVRQLESGGKLVGDNNEPLVYVSELQWLRAENARMREAIKKHGEAYHVGECLKQDIEAPCTCGADDWNALVRSLQ